MNTQQIIELYRPAIIQIATQTSTGTGFYVKEANLIITNEHVVGKNAEVTIAGRNFERRLSRVWYTDKKHDLAFLQPPADIQIPEIKLGKYETVKDGDVVVAIGHPFGLNYTATQGVISKADRVRDGVEAGRKQKESRKSQTLRTAPEWRMATRSCEPRSAAMNSASTRSVPEARSPSRWSAWNGVCWTRRGSPSAAALRWFVPSNSSDGVKAWVTCWRRAAGARRRGDLLRIATWRLTATVDVLKAIAEGMGPAGLVG